MGVIIGRAVFTFRTLPFISFMSMLSIASCASVAEPNVTSAKPLCFPSTTSLEQREMVKRSERTWRLMGICVCWRELYLYYIACEVD